MQNVKTDVSWVREKNFDPLKVNKTDFVIFEEFKGKVFHHLKETKCASIKLEIKEKVQVMGGCYVDNLVEKVTHLVTDNPKSEKYLAAAEAGVTLMCSSWIEAVWVASQAANVHAKDKEFRNTAVYHFKIFVFAVLTDVLVCSGIAGATSEKYKAARKQSDIKCVDISWITESIEKGYALPHTSFPVRKSTSTPSKGDRHVDPDFSTISAIGVPNMSQRVCIEESVVANASLGCYSSPSKPGPSKRKDRITHVIVGDQKYPEVRNIKSKGYPCLLVSVQWLLASMEKEHPLGLSLLRTNKTVTQCRIEEVKENTAENFQNAEDDILKQYQFPSSSAQDEDTLVRLLKNAKDVDFTNQIQPIPQAMHEFKPSETSTQQDPAEIITENATESTSEMFFEGLKFLVIGFDDGHFDYIKSIIEDSSGELVPKTYKGIPDYIVVPVFNKCEIRQTATEIVNELFIKQCELDGCLVTDITYYHRPFDLPDTTPLENCVITISGYSSVERNFLGSLIENLGGQHQEQFARVTSEPRGVVASTHLVSDKPSGKKHAAAIKWGLPAVNKDWLMECAKRGVKVPEKEYIVKMDDSEISPPNSSATTKTATRTSCASGAEASGTPNVGPGSGKKSEFSTPINQRLRRASFSNSADKPMSQVTPVNKIVQQYMESNADGTPVQDSPDHFRWMGMKTPNTPLGLFDPNPSPQVRKECEYWLKQIPDFLPHGPRRLSTPDFQSREDEATGENVAMEVENNEQHRLINSKLQQLEELLSASGGGRRQSRNFQSTIPIPEGNKEYKDSQACTVGWDFRGEEVFAIDWELTGSPFDDTVHVTHCFLEQRSVKDYADYIPLAQQDNRGVRRNNSTNLASGKEKGSSRVQPDHDTRLKYVMFTRSSKNCDHDIR
ncbi:hypothetical protein NQ317_015567 [Molorchus minor]|uniref:BRCT domain-containing protein n=1 Tax=Molorchus minor TaxID=1323400 RepID=A0ABQ9JHW1_9CUCU|nr:hypothetical protein NQ317_015567 [Molorchus minor]